MSSNRDAYTILEIVIAISLIAIFVALPVFAYSTFMKRSRDAQRKSDVSKIQAALEEYKTDNGVYPVDLGDLVEEGYLAELPVDPLDGQNVPGTENTRFGYENNYTASDDRNAYVLSVPLEESGASAQSGGGGPGSGSGSGPVYIVVNPAGTKIVPLPTEGLLSPTFALQPTNTIIPTSFYSPTPTNTPTNTPTLTPTNTPTNTPTLTPSLTPTNTPTLTPSPTRTPTPTPRNCWGINGNCDTACNVTLGASSYSGYYTSCSGPNACWYSGTTKCADGGQYSQWAANLYYQRYMNSSTCSANYFDFRLNSSNYCGAGGTGACYKAINTNCYEYTFTSSGFYNERSQPAGVCSGPYNYLPGGGTFKCDGTVLQCTWGVSGTCGVTMSNVVSQNNMIYAGPCAGNGSGQCYKQISGPLTNAGYDPYTSTTSCNPYRRYDWSNLQSCTWYAN